MNDDGRSSQDPLASRPGAGSHYGGPPAGSSPYGAAAPASPYGVPPGAMPPPPTNGKAIASLVLGIAGCCTVLLYGLGIILAIIGLVLGILAHKEIKGSGGRQGGRGLAVAGIVLGIVTIVLGILLFAIAGYALRACIDDMESAECQELLNPEDEGPEERALAGAFGSDLGTRRLVVDIRDGRGWSGGWSVSPGGI